MRVEKLHHLVGRSDPQERRKDEIKTILDLAMGLFVHQALRVAYQAARKL
jgi:nitrate reductase NapE component